MNHEHSLTLQWLKQGWIAHTKFLPLCINSSTSVYNRLSHINFNALLSGMQTIAQLLSGHLNSHNTNVPLECLSQKCALKSQTHHFTNVLNPQKDFLLCSSELMVFYIPIIIAIEVTKSFIVIHSKFVLMTKNLILRVAWE